MFRDSNYRLKIFIPSEKPHIGFMQSVCFSIFKSISLPEDAQDDYGCSQRDERNTVSDGVANLNRPEKNILKRDLKTTHCIV